MGSDDAFKFEQIDCELLAEEYERGSGEGSYPTYADLARRGEGKFTQCSLRAIARARQGLLSAPVSVRLELAARLNPWRPIDTAPKDRPILAFMFSKWRIAQWSISYWYCREIGPSDSRYSQPRWWVELPAPPSEDVYGLGPAKPCEALTAALSGEKDAPKA